MVAKEFLHRQRWTPVGMKCRVPVRKFTPVSMAQGRPVHRGVQDADDINVIGADPVNDDVRKIGHNYFSRSLNMTMPTDLWKPAYPRCCRANAFEYRPGRLWILSRHILINPVEFSQS